MQEATQNQRPWHAMDLASAIQAVDATEAGLTSAEAQRRLGAYGPNRLPEQPAPSLWQIVLRQFYNPLIYILLIAAVVASALGDFKDAGFIAAVLIINAAIGAVQEWRAEQRSQALRKLLQIRASVRRDGEVQDAHTEQVVPGDVVVLESGNRVPADLRLLTAQGLEVDESLLTGESLPTTKDAAWQGSEASPVGDRLNMCFAGSIVTRGRAVGVVVATGAATTVGQLAADVVGAVSGKSPLLTRMERFTNVVAVGTLAIATGIGILGVALGQYGIAQMFMFVVALAVSAIPEGLPVAMTVALSIATTRMARRGVIVRRLAAVEGLGSCTLIATDKTGTLTANELTVREIRLSGHDEALAVTGEGFLPEGQVLSGGEPVRQGERENLDTLVRAGVLCNEADLHQRERSWVWHGDAVDIALLSLGQKLQLSRPDALETHPHVRAIPFEPENQYAATFNRVGEQLHTFVKGAPERVLMMSELQQPDRDRLEEVARDMAQRGYRVLALAEGAVDEAAKATTEPSHLRFLGFVGMIDPLRQGVREAIEACHDAGIEVIMVTGDHRVTALAIARDLSLAEHEGQVVTGPELTELDRDAMAKVVQRARVFARVAPRQKLQIVEAAQAAGHFVAVTGDGANDAPALRAANIGVAMGRGGTDVAREAAELVISDDNFASIVAGVEEGRIAYDNIRKVIYLLLSTGGAELLMVLLTLIFGLPLPLLPVQLLWLNLVTNGIQGVAIAFEPGEGDTLRRRPRSPHEAIFNRLMIERMIIAVVVIGGLGFGTFFWMMKHGWAEKDARNVLLLLMVLFENFHIGNCRSETKSAFALSPLRSPMLLFGAVAALLLHILSMYLPMLQGVLATASVPLHAWVVVILIALIVVPAIESHKWLWNLRSRLSRQ